MSPSELPLFLKKTEQILGKHWLESASSSPQEIASYYKRLRQFYHRMHSKEGAMHFPIKPLSGGSHAEGLLFHVNDLSDCIRTHNYRRVIELGSGVGYNLIELAKRHSRVHFVGLDLTTKNIKEAQKRAKEVGLSNVTFRLGNFDELANIDLGTPDFVFSIEALCHAKDIQQVFSATKQQLSDNGKMTIFDGYGTEKIRNATAAEQQAADYFSKGFYLPNPQYLADTIQAAKMEGFIQVVTKDYTPNILSNFNRFEDGVKLLFRFPWLSRMLLRLGILPMEIMRHGLAGLYGPYLLQQGLAGYFKLEMR